MSVLQKVQTALSGIGFLIGAGKYPNTGEPCGKIIFTGKEKLTRFLGGEAESEAFKIVVRGNDYISLENMLRLVKTQLKSAEYLQTVGFEDIAPNSGEEFLQLAVTFETI